MATIVRINLISMLDVCGLFQILLKDMDRNITLKKMKIPDFFITSAEGGHFKQEYKK